MGFSLNKLGAVVTLAAGVAGLVAAGIEIAYTIKNRGVMNPEKFAEAYAKQAQKMLNNEMQKA